MSTPFVGEIRLFSTTHVPYGWLPCDGRQLAVSQYTDLFSIIGHTYGGSSPNFMVPNLQGRVVMGAGKGIGLSPRVINDQIGSATATLTSQMLPNHNHALKVTNSVGNALLPADGFYLANDTAQGGNIVTTVLPSIVNDNNRVQLSVDSIGVTGGDGEGGVRSLDNCQPWFGLNYCIALYGQLPYR